MQERIVLMLPRSGPGLFFFKETDQNLSTIPPRMPPAKKRMIALAFQIVIQIPSLFVEVMPVVRNVTPIFADVPPIAGDLCRTRSVAPILP